MGLFRFWKKKRPEPQTAPNPAAPVGPRAGREPVVEPFRPGPPQRIFCLSCGFALRPQDRFCPECGTEVKPMPGPVPTLSVPDSKPRPDPRETAIEYLKKIGRQRDADRLYTLRFIRPDGARTELELPGWQDRSDAMNALLSAGFIRPGESLRINGWPIAQPEIGPAYHHCSACVCELQSSELRLREYRPDPHVCLYGCPNAKGLERRALKKTVEIMDYSRSRVD